MIGDTIGKIEKRLQTSQAVKPEAREELLGLLATLKEEVQQLATTHGEQAESITRFTEVSAHEATREGKNPELAEISLKGLAASVDGFEKSHPQLVQLVNRICTTLSNLGV